jgi:hypothetical protein
LMIGDDWVPVRLANIPMHILDDVMLLSTSI